MPTIRNVSLSVIASGSYVHPDNAVLIQIVDPCYQFPLPKHHFEAVHQFEFLDVEGNDTKFDDFKITQEQAAEIVRTLQSALDQNQNVIVHCHQGLCRSGAVAEVGIMMGFQDTHVPRIPNLLVKSMLVNYLTSKDS
jgi:predicted protein tyrosine phosphatase